MRGFFALRPIAAGKRLIEYRGESASWRQAAARQSTDAAHPFVFGLSDGRVIDGSRDGNSARFLNRARSPNCEAIESGDRVFIHAPPTSRPAASCSSTMRWRSRANPPMRSGNSTHAAGTHPGAGDPCSAPQMVDVDQPNDCCRGRRTPLPDPSRSYLGFELRERIGSMSGHPACLCLATRTACANKPSLCRRLVLAEALPPRNLCFQCKQDAVQPVRYPHGGTKWIPEARAARFAAHIGAGSNRLRAD
jgi:hypothetical protein